jgi:hypothetical protein
MSNVGDRRAMRAITMGREYRYDVVSARRDRSQRLDAGSFLRCERDAQPHYRPGLRAMSM